MNIYDIVAAGQVMPVIVIDRASDAVALGNALLEGGIKTAEVTLRTPQALVAIEAMATACPELMVGAGTVLNAEHARQVRDAGGCFAVSPGATDALIQGCADTDLPLLPGASSVSEVMRLGEKGFFMLKFFPATAAGGLPLSRRWQARCHNFSFVQQAALRLRRHQTGWHWRIFPVWGAAGLPRKPLSLNRIFPQ